MAGAGLVAAGAEVVAGGGGAGAAEAAAAAVAAAGPGATTVLGFWPALIAADWSWNVVETIGQPCPGPLRFCSVTDAAFRRACADAVELSVGKVS